jgi:hypothetical protein
MSSIFGRMKKPHRRGSHQAAVELGWTEKIPFSPSEISPSCPILKNVKTQSKIALMMKD